MYLTAEEYEEITGKPEEEATEQRLKYASQLLDSRIGDRFRKRGLPYPFEDQFRYPQDQEFTLEMDRLYTYQKDAVKSWVAWMVSYLAENNDQAPSTASVSLGRFSVTHSEQSIIPESMRMADAVLASSGLVSRKVKVR